MLWCLSARGLPGVQTQLRPDCIITAVIARVRESLYLNSSTPTPENIYAPPTVHIQLSKQLFVHTWHYLPFPCPRKTNEQNIRETFIAFPLSKRRRNKKKHMPTPSTRWPLFVVMDHTCDIGVEVEDGRQVDAEQWSSAEIEIFQISSCAQKSWKSLLFHVVVVRRVCDWLICLFICLFVWLIGAL